MQAAVKPYQGREIMPFATTSAGFTAVEFGSEVPGEWTKKQLAEAQQRAGVQVVILSTPVGQSCYYNHTPTLVQGRGLLKFGLLKFGPIRNLYSAYKQEMCNLQ